MKSIWTGRIVLAFFLCAEVATTRADTFVSSPYPSSVINGGGFGCCSSKTYLYSPETFESSREVRNRASLFNRVDWQFSDRTADFARLNIETDAYSVFIPEHVEYSCSRDGTCGPRDVSDFYDDSTVTGRIPLELSRPLFVTVTLDAAAIHGAPYFNLDYLGRTVNYATDVSSGILLPSTNMLPNAATDDPLDVMTYTDQFWVPAGTSLIDFELRSSFLEYAKLFDGSARISVTFSTVPEPTTLPFAVTCCVLAVIKNRSRRFQIPKYHRVA